MTALELEKRRSMLAEALSYLDTEEEISRAERFFARLQKKQEQFPCQYTAEELHIAASEAQEDLRMGRVYSTDDVRKMVETFPCQYTAEELHKQLDSAEESMRKGLGCTTENLRKRALAG